MVRIIEVELFLGKILSGIQIGSVMYGAGELSKEKTWMERGLSEGNITAWRMKYDRKS